MSALLFQPLPSLKLPPPGWGGTPCFRLHYLTSVLLFVPWGAEESYSPSSWRGEASALSAGASRCLLATAGKETALPRPMIGPDSRSSGSTFIVLHSFFVPAPSRFLALIYSSLGCVKTDESAESHRTVGQGDKTRRSSSVPLSLPPIHTFLQLYFCCLKLASLPALGQTPRVQSPLENRGSL